jgi:hypothetical protein
MSIKCIISFIYLLLYYAMYRSANEILARHSKADADACDPRAQYIKWYREGQRRVAESALRSLNEVIDQQDDEEEEGDEEEEEDD